MRQVSRDLELSEYLAFTVGKFGLQWTGISRDRESGPRNVIKTTERDISNQINVKQKFIQNKRNR